MTTAAQDLARARVSRDKALVAIDKAHEGLRTAVHQAKAEKMSVTHIAELTGLSRQGIYDILKKGTP